MPEGKRAISSIESSGLPSRMTEKLLDAFTEALGRIVAEQRREWEKDLERIQAEARATIAELKEANARLEVQIREALASVDAKVAARIAELKGGTPGKDGEPGAAGRDGASIVSLVIDRGGHLIAALGDGAQRDLGLIVGKDGDNGKDGAPGRDGFGFDDLSAELVDRDLVLTFIRGDEKKSFTLPLPIVVDRGVFRTDAAYKRGDSVTWAGCSWIAQEDVAEEKPNVSKKWRLAVKCGRDGKDGKDGKDGDRGPIGPKGDPGNRY